MSTYVVWEPFEEEDSIIAVFATTNRDAARAYAKRRNDELGVEVPHLRVHVAWVPALTDEEAEAMAAGICHTVVISFDGEIFSCRRTPIDDDVHAYLSPEYPPRFTCNRSTKHLPAMTLVVFAQDYGRAIMLAPDRLQTVKERFLSEMGYFVDEVNLWKAADSPCGEFDAYEAARWAG